MGKFKSNVQNYEQDFTNDGEPLSRCNPTDWFEAENDHFVSCSKFETFDTPETKIVQDAEFDLQNVVNQLRPQKISVKTGPRKIRLPEN